MRALLRSGLLWPSCLVACSATPLMSPGSEYREVVYRVDSIAPPEGLLAVAAADINNQGQVAGSALGPSGQEAFTWSAGNGFVTLARIATADHMSAVAINESGVVVGNADWQDGTSRPVLWVDPGHAQDLGVSGRYAFESPEASWSVESATATGINNRGHVVGTTSASEFAGVAYLWDATRGMELLGTLGGLSSWAWAVNASDDVVGTSEMPDGTSHAFLWSKGSMTDLGALGGAYSEAYAISDASEVTGVYQRPSGETRVFRWTRSGGMVDAGPTYAEPTDGATSMSTGINAAGQIVGGIQPPGQLLRAAVRQPASREWQELQPGAPYQSFALDVNDRGVIVGHVSTSLDVDEPTRAAVWTPVPSGVVVTGSP